MYTWYAHFYADYQNVLGKGIYQFTAEDQSWRWHDDAEIKLKRISTSSKKINIFLILWLFCFLYWFLHFLILLFLLFIFSWFWDSLTVCLLDLLMLNFLLFYLTVGFLNLTSDSSLQLFLCSIWPTSNLLLLQHYFVFNLIHFPSWDFFSTRSCVLLFFFSLIFLSTWLIFLTLLFLQLDFFIFQLGLSSSPWLVWHLSTGFERRWVQAWERHVRFLGIGQTPREHRISLMVVLF